MLRIVSAVHRRAARSVVVGATAALALQVLAAGAAAAATEIWSRSEEFVRIEPQDNHTAPENDHPVEIASAQIGALLGSLKVSPEDDEAPVPVFSKEEVAVLGPALSEGLAKAAPRQDVSFATIGSHKLGGFLGRRLVNTGRVFHRDGRLNIIFGEVHADYRKKNVYGQREEDFLPRRYASRSTAADGDWRLVEQQGIERYVDAGRERPDWLVIEPRLATAAVAHPADAPQPQHPGALAATGQQAAAGDALPAVSPGSPEERLAKLKSLRDQELIPEELYRTKVEEILDAEAAAPSASIEQRLKLLKQLRQQGVISEESYRARVEQIVEAL